MNKIVNIFVDAATGELRVVPDKVKIRVSDGDQVDWDSPHGEARITFKGDSPFEAKVFVAPRGGGVRSGRSSEDKVRADMYKYDVELTIPAAGNNAARTLKKDPGVIVEG
jgi:hypothetical protein